MSLGDEALRELMLRANAGEHAAYLELLTILGGRLRAFFRKRLYALPDEVEDLVQETLLAIHIHRDSYDVRRPLLPWVYAIARYKLADLLRRRAAREVPTDPLGDGADLLAATDCYAGEAHTDIEALLALLPERQRLPIQYVKLDGLSVADAARMTGMSESAVKVGIHRGLRALALKIRGNR